MTKTKTTLKTEELNALIAKSPIVSPDVLAERVRKKDGIYVFSILRKTTRSLAGKLDVDDECVVPIEYSFSEVTLISPEEFDYTPKLTASDLKAAESINAKTLKYKGYFAYDRGLLNPTTIQVDAAAAELPSIIDHRSSQSAVKNQGSVRGTCVAHASMGLLEAFAHIPDDLSEQYTHYKFMIFSNLPQNVNAGIKTTDAAPFLARNDGRTCLESEWPYIPDQTTINNMVANGTYAPPQAAVNDQRFGIGAYKIIEDKGLTGESIKNTRYLEALLYQGYNIVFGCFASWDDKDNNGILDPLLDNNGNPVVAAGHAMLIVGYNRDSQYFIVKNSWNSTWGHNGYAYLSYNFVRACAKYGFTVDTVVPPAPPSPLPRKLAIAPFSTNKISRANLRAAVVFFKTSSGRYAVSEAYAGDNLYLRNLRVYNANGSVHLSRDSLVVRSSYLCDLDTGAETSLNADFWWEGVSPGINYLVPRNGAAACIAFNIASLTAANINSLSLTTSAVEWNSLNYAVIVGKTTDNLPFKILAHAKPGNTLQLSYVEVFKADGMRYKYGQEINVPSSWTYNLDGLTLSGGTAADIWWHVISNNVGFLERYSNAKMKLLWSL